MPKKKPGLDAHRGFVTSKLFSLVMLGLCFVFLLFVRFHVNHAITGDEPHYLLMDYSLVHDGDLNLKNNYQTPSDYYGFYPAPLGPKGQVDAKQLKTNSPKFYSIHGIGIPFISLPGYLADKATGVAVEMTLIATGVIWLTWLWTFQVTKQRGLAMVSAALLASTLFFSGLAGYIYPDMIIAGLTLAALIILNRYFEKPAYQFLFGVLLASLVFLHFKTLTLAAPLFLIMTYKCWKAKRGLPWAAILGGGPLILYFFFSLHHWYGVWDPAQIYSSNISLKTSPLHTIPAMLFDSKRGLLVYNPVVLLVFVGIFPWFRQSKKSFIITALALLPSVALLTTFNLWDGGYAPVGRYVMDFLPALMPAMAFALGLMRTRWQRALVAALALATLFITIESTLIKTPYIDPLIFRTRSTFFARLEKQTGVGFDHLLPNFSNRTTLNDRRGLLKVSIGCLVVASLTGYGYVLSKTLKPLKD